MLHALLADWSARGAAAILALQGLSSPVLDAVMILITMLGQERQPVGRRRQAGCHRLHGASEGRHIADLERREIEALAADDERHRHRRQRSKSVASHHNSTMRPN